MSNLQAPRILRIRGASLELAVNFGRGRAASAGARERLKPSLRLDAQQHPDTAKSENQVGEPRIHAGKLHAVERLIIHGAVSAYPPRPPVFESPSGSFPPRTRRKHPTGEFERVRLEGK